MKEPQPDLAVVEKAAGAPKRPRLAHDTSEPATRAVLTDMATAWIKLGEQAEKNGQTDLVYETPALHS
jgi:hypothetical protein